MPQQSTMHFYLNWAKERIEEMDAVLASLETKAGEVQADLKAKAKQLIADLKKQRNEFQATVKKQSETDEAAWGLAKAQLESQWNAFESQFKIYIDTIAKQIPHQQAIFREVAAAQLKAWRVSADMIQSAATKFAAGQRANIDAAVKQMKADASVAEAKLQKLQGESWTALNAALAESRGAFDHANKAAWDTFKRAASPHAG